jgi:hypothetical protein
MARKKQSSNQFPWGRAAGLLVACVSTVAGAVQGAGPPYLLYRACIGSVVACIIVRMFTGVILASTVSREP